MGVNSLIGRASVRNLLFEGSVDCNVVGAEDIQEAFLGELQAGEMGDDVLRRATRHVRASGAECLYISSSMCDPVYWLRASE